MEGEALFAPGVSARVESPVSSARPAQRRRRGARPCTYEENDRPSVMSCVGVNCDW